MLLNELTGIMGGQSTVYEVAPVPTADVSRAWDILELFIVRAMEHSNGECALAKIKSETEQGLRQLWRVAGKEGVAGALLTRVLHYHNCRTVIIDFLAGDGFDNWLEEADTAISAWGKSIGAKRIEVLGRKGFSRKLKDYRYEITYYHMTKELDVKDTR